jgi:long-chain acyl-CoA synthetase
VRFGILQTGAVVVPINNFLKPAEVNYILNDGGIDVVITDAELGAHAGTESRAAALKIFKVEEIAALPSDSEFHAFSDSRRKRFGRHHLHFRHDGQTEGRDAFARQSAAQRQQLPHRFGIRAGRLLRRAAADVSHLHDDRGIFLPFTTGGSIVLVKSLHPPRAMLQEIFRAAPHPARRAVVLPDAARRATAHAAMPIRIFISGSAPLPMQTLKEFEEKFKVPLIEGYGLSEASPVVSKNPLHGVHKAGSIGIPIPMWK